MKDYYPIDIELLHNEIKDDEKIKNMIHQNFCRYLKQKGKNKNKFCLNRFKDINELKYCATHRYELKPYIKCINENCDGNTKNDLCKKCRTFYNKKIPKFKLPPQTDEEINLLLNYNGLIEEIIYPKGKYFIKNYNNHIYYKTTSIKIDLILPKYDEKGLKIKTIKKENYICLYNPFMTIRMKFELKGCINHYNTYINDLYNKYKINNVISFSKIFYNKFKNFISLDKACNVPLPPVTNDEEILLNLNDLKNFNNTPIGVQKNKNLKKPKWEENDKLVFSTCKQIVHTNIYDLEENRKQIDVEIQCNLLNDAIIENKLELYEKGNKSYYHYISKNEDIIFNYDKNMQLILYNENGFEATNNYMISRIKKYKINKKKNINKKRKKKLKKVLDVGDEVTEKDILNDEEKTHCLNIEMKIINEKYGLRLEFIDEEIKRLMDDRKDIKNKEKNYISILKWYKGLNFIYYRKINEHLHELLNKVIKERENVSTVSSFYDDIKYLLEFYINDYNHFMIHFKSRVFEDD